MSVFYTSDTHIGHRRVAEIRWGRMHPAVDVSTVEDVVAWHDATLAANWDATVSSDDNVWVLGDLAVSGTKTTVGRALEWIAARRGRKHLIAGNHDACHPMHRDSHRWQKTYLEVFESVQLAARRKFVMPDGSPRSVLLSHMPYRGDRGGVDRDPQWRLRDCGDWLLHGHLHGDTPHHTNGTKQLDVGLDPFNLRPVGHDALVLLMALLEGLETPPGAISIGKENEL